MVVNVNHPEFITFIEKLSSSIAVAVPISDYFKLSSDKKVTTTYTVFSMIKNMTKIKIKLTDTELKNFLIVLRRNNEENENYEFASILNDIVKNFDTMNNFSTTISKKPIKTKKKIDNDLT
jgi:hypothetical protein